MKATKKSKPAKPLRIGDLVFIEWEDATLARGWREDEPWTEPTVCHSVGWLVYNGKQAKTIAPTVQASDRGLIGDSIGARCEALVIPTGCILRFERLRQP